MIHRIFKLTVVLAFISFTAFAQTNPWVHDFLCRTPSTGDACNYISNNIFQQSPSNVGSFKIDIDFIDWKPGPLMVVPSVTEFDFCNQIGCTILPTAPPVPNTDFAVLWAVARSNHPAITDPNQNVPFNTPLFQKIKPLTAGEEYVLSFYKVFYGLLDYDLFAYPGIETINHMARFKIVLMHCSEYGAVVPPNEVYLSADPINSQVIYEEINLNNPDWEQVVTCFQAADNYNMILVYPMQTDYEFNMPWGNEARRSVGFAYPQIFAKDEASFSVVDMNAPGVCQKMLVPNACIEIPNATYSWYQEGSLSPFSTEQQPIIDAALIHGNIQLVVTFPGTHGGNCSITSPFVLVEACPTSNIWPKVYATDWSGVEVISMAVGGSGNVFAMMPWCNPAINLNHTGTLPPVPQYGHFSFQYSADGVVQWFREDLKGGISYLFESKDIQMVRKWDPAIATYFMDGATGSNMSAPAGLNTGELVVAELGNGRYITRSWTRLYVHTPSGSSSVNVGGYLLDTKFNLSTQVLTILHEQFGSSLHLVDTYLLSGDQLLLQGSVTMTVQADNRLIVDNSDNVYCLGNGELRNLLGGGAVMIPGFNNSELKKVANINAYTSDELLLYSQADTCLYYLNFGNMTSKKAATVNYMFPIGYYGIYQGDIYVMGIVAGGNVEIGSQTISCPPGVDIGVYLTKLDLQQDFNRMAAGRGMAGVGRQHKTGSGVELYPNPASSALNVVSGSGLIRSVQITDMSGRVMKEVLMPDSREIQISTAGLQPGVYSCRVDTEAGKEVKRVVIIK